VAISTIFQKRWEAWNVATREARDSFRQELDKKQDLVHQKLINEEAPLRLALRDEVVENVIKVFPCIFSRVSLSIVC
jgi:hypothetical protein